MGEPEAGGGLEPRNRRSASRCPSNPGVVVRQAPRRRGAGSRRKEPWKPGPGAEDATGLWPWWACCSASGPPGASSPAAPASRSTAPGWCARATGASGVSWRAPRARPRSRSTSACRTRLHPSAPSATCPRSRRRPGAAHGSRTRCPRPAPSGPRPPARARPGPCGPTWPRSGPCWPTRAKTASTSMCTCRGRRARV
jgi:hypothetical protein